MNEDIRRDLAWVATTVLFFCFGLGIGSWATEHRVERKQAERDAIVRTVLEAMGKLER
jgi:hypothetical protein